MAHDIATIDGKNTIAYVGETPWHRLGQVLTAGATLDDGFAAAGLDWDVEISPAFIEVGDQRIKLATQAVYRRDGDAVVTLGEVGPKYRPIQHRKAFRIFEPAIGAGQLRLEVLGALGNGGVVWTLFKLAEEGQVIRTNDDGTPDRVLPYVLAQTSHDGTRQFTVKPTAIRVVCRNTLNASGDPRADAWINIRHTESAEKQIEEVGSVLDRAAAQYRATCKLFRELAAAEVSEAELLDYINDVLPLPVQPKSIFTIAQEQGTAAANALLGASDSGTLDAPSVVIDAKDSERKLRFETAVARITEERTTVAKFATQGAGNNGSSLWDGYNGVTEFVDHTARRDTDHATKQAAIRAVSGDGAVIKDRAFELALERLGALVAA